MHCAAVNWGQMGQRFRQQGEFPPDSRIEGLERNGSADRGRNRDAEVARVSKTCPPATAEAGVEAGRSTNPSPDHKGLSCAVRRSVRVVFGAVGEPRGDVQLAEPAAQGLPGDPEHLRRLILVPAGVFHHERQ